MSYEPLSDSTFLLYAAKHYDNPHCFDMSEFNEDMNRFKYIKRLFNRYKETGELKERLILNHIIVIYNLFGVDAATKMLFFKLGKYMECLKPFLIMLNYMPQTKDADMIQMDPKIVEKLRKI